MRGRRLVGFGACAAFAALLMSGCGVSPPLLPPVDVSSPYVSNSTAQYDALSGFGRQEARVKVCSLTGGPLTVDVHSPGADADTQLMVRAVSTDEGGERLIDQFFPKTTVTLDVHVESSRALRSGECVDVNLNSTHNLFEAGDAFYYTVSW